LHGADARLPADRSRPRHQLTGCPARVRFPTSSSPTASRSRSSASASSRCRRRRPRPPSRRPWRPGAPTSTPPPPTATRRGPALAASGLPREEIFVTTKLANSEQGHDSALHACARSLEALGLDHVDLYLIHWPLPAADLYLDTWRAFEALKIEGRARSIGVS